LKAIKVGGRVRILIIWLVISIIFTSGYILGAIMTSGSNKNKGDDK